MQSSPVASLHVRKPLMAMDPSPCGLIQLHRPRSSTTEEPTIASSLGCPSTIVIVEARTMATPMRCLSSMIAAQAMATVVTMAIASKETFPVPPTTTMATAIPTQPTM